MLSLNLISPEQKKIIKIRGFYIMLKNITIMFLILTIAISITLLLSKMILQNNFNRIVSESTLITRYSKVVGVGITEFNKDLAIIDEIQKNYIDWTNFIATISNQSNSGVSFYSFNVDSTNNQLEIDGFALTRDDLLDFKDKLDNLPLIDTAEIPLNNLLNRRNIDFEIKAQINIEEIKKL